MKKPLIIGALALAVAGAIAFKHHEPSIASVPAGLEKYEEATRLEVSEALKVGGAHVIPPPAPIDFEASQAAFGQLLKDSKAKLGYSSDKPSEYESYNEEALTKMSFEGDGKASMELLNRHKKEPDFVNEKLWTMAVEAAANGQTAALMQLSSWEILKIADKSEASKEHMLYALSYAYAADELGDNGHVDTNMIISRSFGLELNEDDFARIIRDGKKVITELDQNRAVRGLGAIDRDAIWQAANPDGESLRKGWTPEAKNFYAYAATAK